MAGNTWAKKSLALLMKYGLQDFDAWPGDSVAEYGKFLEGRLAHFHLEKWVVAANRHCIPVPYLKVMPCIPSPVRTCLSLGISWKELLWQRSLIRLRCGLVPLGHKNGRHSSARVQSCVCCGGATANTWVHVFGACPKWDVHRASAAAQLGLHAEVRTWDIMYAVLACRPNEAAFQQCVYWTSCVVEHAECFWRGR